MMFPIRQSRSLRILLHSKQQVRRKQHIFSAKDAKFYQFGSDKLLFHDDLSSGLSWDLHAQGSQEVWAILGPGAGQFLSASLQGRTRVEPASARRWPFLEGQTGYLLDRVIQQVAFKTRLEARGPSASGEFVDFTARYGGLREEDRLTLKDHLKEYMLNNNIEVSEDLIKDTAERFEIGHLLAMPLVALSNGQTRRARVVRALLAKPHVLLLEQPFTGLDIRSREVLSTQLMALHKAKAPVLVFSLRQQDGLPQFITHVVQLGEDEKGQGKIKFVGKREDMLEIEEEEAEHSARTDGLGLEQLKDAQTVIQLRNVNVTGRTPILRGVSWTIKEGERYRLKGPNGSGKSTLLSLITGDHPQSYAESVELFGHKRSDLATVKLQSFIGHISPEIYNAFPRRHIPGALTAKEAICTGFDSIFSYRKITATQEQRLNEIAAAFNMSTNWLNTPFAELPPGDQSLALFLRALVKKPRILILDEPYSGMTAKMVNRCQQYIDHELDERQSVIFISHFDDEVPKSVTKVLALDDGRVVEST